MERAQELAKTQILSREARRSSEQRLPLVGLLQQDGRDGLVSLDHPDPELGKRIRIPQQRLNGAPFGMMVVVKLLGGGDVPYGEIEEVIGDPGRPDVAMAAILRAHGLTESFPEAVLREAELLALDPSAEAIEAALAEGRVDLREQFSFTIDGEDAKDLDDAVALDVLPNGQARLYVHIADVTAFVAAGSALDLEAKRRGNSVYLADRVLPMYPPRLSNGLCSLNPERPRFCLTAEILLDERGERKESKIYESLICSKRRSSYREVQAILDGTVEDESLPSDFIEAVQAMARWARILQARRASQGALRFPSHETEIRLDADGRVQKIAPQDNSFSHEIIESFMIAANEAVAHACMQKQIPAIYRVHEEPDAERLTQFQRLLRYWQLGLRLSAKAEPRELQRVLERLMEDERGRVRADLLLRAMAKARYDAANLGHYALASEEYCHFTSPIRRYADDFVHRSLKTCMRTGRGYASQAEAGQVAAWISGTERVAVSCERDSQAQKICEYYSEHLGEFAEGTIVGFSSFAAYVALDNGAEGALMFAGLPGYFHYDELRQEALNEQSGYRLSLGDRLRVQIARVDLAKRQLDFALVEQVTECVGRQGPIWPKGARKKVKRGSQSIKSSSRRGARQQPKTRKAARPGRRSGRGRA